MRATGIEPATVGWISTLLSIGIQSATITPHPQSTNLVLFLGYISDCFDLVKIMTSLSSICIPSREGKIGLHDAVSASSIFTRSIGSDDQCTKPRTGLSVPDTLIGVPGNTGPDSSQLSAFAKMC